MSKNCHVNRREHRAHRVVVEALVALAGVTLLLLILAADQAWVDRHFLPDFFSPHRTFVLYTTIARVLVVTVALALLLGARPKLGRLAAKIPPVRLLTDIASLLVAVLLALLTSELVLRRISPRATMERPLKEEPRRQRNARLGWVFVPLHTGGDNIGGRSVQYAFDAAGYRVRAANQPVDHSVPTILFTGESVMMGHALNWEETIPAQVESLTHVQSANLAVGGYATDQAFLHLQSEIPRFPRAIAVVTIFMPTLFDRNLMDDRPHLDADLTWHPAYQRWQLVSIAKWLVPYRGDAAIERGIVTTRNVLRATVQLTQAHGAVPLIIVPQFEQEGPIERGLRERILAEPRLPYVSIVLNPAWRVRGDGHPDPRAAHAIAEQIANYLESAAATQASPPGDSN
jgi:hypothetical protein